MGRPCKCCHEDDPRCRDCICTKDEIEFVMLVCNSDGVQDSEFNLYLNGHFQAKIDALTAEELDCP